ncbi:MAG TPA: glycoside hydrolase family 43 protein [Thermoanaerobaculia bacterium]|nr:glycoside hydrolase family 43 protein [Thermoanaerobaculia bacterium]
MTYTNPVYPYSFPDPFVLKHRGEYWGYCTGLWRDGRAFGVIRSRDLVHWEERPGALEPLPGNHPCYWAPEAAFFEGRFYLYYSVGNEERMEIRVAVADHPGGPFVDSGHRLTAEPFAIDAHVFTDEDGSRWLFYAADFLDREHAGTGTVRDRLLDPFTLEGNPRPVALPRHDWHVYHPNRPEKGGVRWHTVEGPFVLRRKGLLYEMFSGGNWQNPTYGVSYARARDLAGPAEWDQAALPILRSGGEVVGPGHNSAVRGPDNRQLYCVYHRWSADLKERVMAIDPLDWAGERMLVLGPTTTPQPGPLQPALSDLLDAPALLEPPREIWYGAAAPSFLAEVSVRGGGAVALRGAGAELVRVTLRPEFQLLRVEVDGHRVSFSHGGAPFWRGRMAAHAAGLALCATGEPAEFSGFSLTLGWEDLFEEDGDPAGLGWEILQGSWTVRDGRLWGEAGGAIAKGPLLGSYLAVINARLEAGEGYVFTPAMPAGSEDPRIELERHGTAWCLRAIEQIFPLPSSFDPAIDQQFRFRKEEGTVEIAWEGLRLGTGEAPPGPTRVGMAVPRGAASFEAVRVTAL